MKCQVLNEIKEFAGIYHFEDILTRINAIPNDVSEDDLKKELETLLLSIYTNIEDDVKASNDNLNDVAIEALRDAKKKLVIVIAKIIYGDDIKNDAVNEVIDFLTTEEKIIESFTNRNIRQSLEGKSKKAIKVDGKTIAIAGAVVVLAGGIILLVHNSKKNNTNEEETPKETVEASTTKPVETKEPVRTIIPIIEDTTTIDESKIESAANKVYQSWINVTDAYSVEDIENVIKAIYGLDSNLTIDEADDIIQDVLEKVTIPKVNNILVGTKYDVQTIDVASLLVNGSKTVDTMQGIFNTAVTSKNIEDTALKALEEEVKAYEGDLLVGVDPAEKIVWSRLTICTNAIHGTLGKDISIKYDGTVYTQEDILNGAYLDRIASDSKKEISGNIK